MIWKMILEHKPLHCLTAQKLILLLDLTQYTIKTRNLTDYSSESRALTHAWISNPNGSTLT